MKRIWAFLFCLAMTLGWAEAKKGSLQLQLLPGQALRLELTAGNYRIEPGAGDKIVVISQSSKSQRTTPRFGIDTNPQEACVKVVAPQNYAAVIQIPSHSNLKVRLNGGNLRVDGITGDKDIESHAGAVSIGVGAPENYARVEASVNVGHIDALPFQASEEGFVRSISHDGPGRYRLHAHVDAGEITLF